jgi:hypothetical protein
VDNVWLDTEGMLHLRLYRGADGWTSSEVIGPVLAGYAAIEIEVAGSVAQLDPNVVAGFFVYENDESEIDIEFSRWGEPMRSNGLFAIHGVGGRKGAHEFGCDRIADTARLAIDWAPRIIRFSVDGCRGPRRSWVFRGREVPRPNRHRLRFNLWSYRGKPPADGQAQEIVIRDVRIIER